MIWWLVKLNVPGIAAPLRALIGEVDHDTHAEGTAPPDLATVSARWAQVRDAIPATVRARIIAAQAAQAPAPKR